MVIRSIVVCSILCLLMLALAGCPALGVAAYKIMGPPPVPAKYVPAKTPMLVMVENYHHQSSANAHADLLGRLVMRQIEINDIAPIIDPDKLQELKDEKAGEFAKMSIQAIGQAVGAEQVLYIELHNSDITPLVGGEGFSGKSSASVKLISVHDGQTLWPTDIAQGYTVSGSSRFHAADAQDPMKVRQKLYGQMSDQIAKLFYKWKPDDMSPETYGEQ